MRFRSTTLATVMACLGGAIQAQAPKPAKPLPVIRGEVQDTSGAGLAGAQVEVLGAERTATTSARGGYRLEQIPPGRYWVIARRIGYAPLRAALTFNPGDDREIVFQLEPLPQILPEEVVSAADLRWQQRYRDFLWRSRSGPGRFLTRDDLKKDQRAFLDEVVSRYLIFRRFDPSVSAFSIGRGAGLSSGRSCSPMVSLNGNTPLGGWTLGDFRTEDVEAVEIYSWSRSFPIEFQHWQGRCGLVVVWTR
jgi:hypothetical protein